MKFTIHYKMVDKIIELMTGSLTLISALAWNSAFQKTLDNNKYLKNTGPWIYAILITLISVILITSFSTIKKDIKNLLQNNISKIPYIILILILCYITYIYVIFPKNSKSNKTLKENKKDNNSPFLS